MVLRVPEEVAWIEVRGAADGAYAVRVSPGGLSELKGTAEGVLFLAELDATKRYSVEIESRGGRLRVAELHGQVYEYKMSLRDNFLVAVALIVRRGWRG
jgi:hypothetical protein